MIWNSSRTTTSSCVFCRLTAWWRHQMETFSALLALCAENSPVNSPSQRWIESPSRKLMRHCNGMRHKELGCEMRHTDVVGMGYQFGCRRRDSIRADSVITMTSLWARWHLKTPASRLFAQTFVQAQIKENIKSPRYWPLWWESTGCRWIPLTKVSNTKIVSIWWHNHAFSHGSLQNFLWFPDFSEHRKSWNQKKLHVCRIFIFQTKTLQNFSHDHIFHDFLDKLGFMHTWYQSILSPPLINFS